MPAGVDRPKTMRLLAGGERALRAGRRWAYRGEVAGGQAAASPGEVVDLLGARDAFVGRGWYNPRSKLVFRLLTERAGEAVDEAFFLRRLDAAWAYRERVLDPEGLGACRVVFAEADLLPGLIVDRFGPAAVIQSLCLGLDPWQPLVVDWLMRRLPLQAVYERNDGRIRRIEGLPERRGFVAGQPPPEVVIAEGPLRLRIDVAGGQKTGHFLDQRLNRLAWARLVARRVAGAGSPAAGGGLRVLDAFSHTGGFGLQAAAAGAAEVTLLDQDAGALALAAENAARNGLSERVACLTGNAFDELRAWDRQGRRFDCVVLDPPAFAKGAAALDGAYRGYKEINLRALRLLDPGGLLCTCSCSQPVSDAMFGEMLADAAADAGRRLRVLERRGAAPDHPGLLGAAETSYLKCWLVEAV